MDEPKRAPGPFLDLSPRQRSAISVALTIVAAAVILSAILGFGWAASAFIRRFSGVFLPIAVGAVAALVFAPYYGLLHRRLRFPVPLALAAVFLSVLLPIAAFGWFFGAIVVEQLSELITRMPSWWENVATQAKDRWPQMREFLEHSPWVQRLRTVIEGQSGTLVQGLSAFGGKALSAGAGIFRALGSMAAWAVLPVYFIFFLIAEPRKAGDLERLLPFLKPESRRDLIYLFTEFLNIIVAFFRGQLIIALLQGLLFAIGFSLIGLRYGFVLGLLLGLLNIIPYLGSMIGLAIGLPLAFFQEGGSWQLAVWLLVVFTIVQLIESYLLTPRLMGERTGLHPLAIIVAIFFWGTALDGILGMILAIPLTAFLVVFWRLAREKYIGELL